ncbi:MAG TPA: glycerol-3-phosphate dehydrogenase/oxidase [Nitrospiria bacterium]|nr:glycerol-3-phosphate dehydrogenase/oxidase [Nitrospiria bacterium]
MKRDLTTLTQKTYDLLVIGGGIFGVCAAWDAALRGLSVALIDQGDFGHATSANCFKIVHGGIRYLQHGDVYRIRESSRERTALLRIAPHLVHPLPIVIPTYGHGLKGKEFLRTGCLVYDMVTFDRNRSLEDSQQRIPPCRLVSREECLSMFPGLNRAGLTGAVMFYDGQMRSPSRLALSFLKSAVSAGADAANYVEATGFLKRGNRIYGVKAVDRLTGDALEVQGKMVLNTTGPWAERFLKVGTGLTLRRPLSFSRDAFFTVARPLVEKCGLALQSASRDPDALISRGSRHLFAVPWRGHTLFGVWHVVHSGAPDAFEVTENNLRVFLSEINEAYPEFGLTLKDVSSWHAGLVLFGENRPGATDLSYGKRSIVIDHASEHDLEGLISVVGVRYTTARGVAENAVDLVFKKFGKKAPRSMTAETPIWGGRIERFDEFLGQSLSQFPKGFGHAAASNMIHNYGSEWKGVMRCADGDPGWAETVGGTSVIKAEVVHAVREEMASKLADVVLRRTDMGNAGYPGRTALNQCAEVMARELGWDAGRVESEISETERLFPGPIHHDRPLAATAPSSIASKAVGDREPKA